MSDLIHFYSQIFYIQRNTIFNTLDMFRKFLLYKNNDIYLCNIKCICEVSDCVVDFVIEYHLHDGDGQVHPKCVVQHEPQEHHYVEHLHTC